MDVIAIFLNGMMEENVTMEIPNYFLKVRNPIKVCKVKITLYGLKQSPRAWYSMIDEWRDIPRSK
jgi:hypothetical protein